MTWLPTEENLAVLPAGVKQYIHALETFKQTADAVRREVLLRDEVAQLRALVEADHQDAERYRLLRDKSQGGWIELPPGHGLINCDEPAGEWDAACDRAIDDAAMGSEASDA